MLGAGGGFCCFFLSVILSLFFFFGKIGKLGTGLILSFINLSLDFNSLSILKNDIIIMQYCPGSSVYRDQKNSGIAASFEPHSLLRKHRNHYLSCEGSRSLKSLVTRQLRSNLMPSFYIAKSRIRTRTHTQSETSLHQLIPVKKFIVP